MSRVEWQGYDRLQARLARVADASGKAAGVLGERLEAIVVEDNRRGVLAGLDKDDRPMVPVARRKGRYKGLTGPPLAPRGTSSRAIAGLVVRRETVGGMPVVIASWPGVPFLAAHFRGARAGRNGRVKLPVRNLAGLRPWGREQARRAAREWAMDLLRGD